VTSKARHGRTCSGHPRLFCGLEDMDARDAGTTG
jgi:hypothetical protein